MSKRKSSKMEQLEKDVAKIKRDYRPEVKSNPVTATAQINIAGTIHNMNLMAQGAGANQRVGMKVYNRRCIANLWLTKDATNTDRTDTIRLIWFRDLAHNGVAPAVLDVLLAVDPVTTYNYDLRKRIKVISDKHVILGDIVNFNGPLTKMVRYDFKLNTHCYYQGVGANEASIEKGPLYLLMVTSAVATANSQPRYELRADLRYSDA